MEQGPSWVPNRYSATQEILRIKRNPNLHYRIYKRHLPVPILSQVNPVNAPFPFLEDPSKPRSLKLSISARSSHHTPVRACRNTTAYFLF